MGYRGCRRPVGWVVLALGAGLGLGCAGDDGDGPGSAGPHMQITTIFSSSTSTVYTVRPDWSPEGTTIVFAGGPGGNIWKVAATAGSVPVPVTDPDSSDFEAGGYVPSYLADGRIAYYIGWIGDDHDMHVLAASAEQQELIPPPSILHSFNGSDVGMAHDAAASPEAMSVAGDGHRAVALWGSSSLYTLDWSGGNVVAVRISDSIGGTIWDPVISRDGSTIAFANGEQEIVRIPFEGGTPSVVGQGWYPSWSGDGNLIGFVNPSFEGYVVYDVGTGSSTTYAISGSIAMQYTALSWDGTKVTFRTFGGPNNGISVGTLVP